MVAAFDTGHQGLLDDTSTRWASKHALHVSASKPRCRSERTSQPLPVENNLRSEDIWCRERGPQGPFCWGQKEGK